MAEALTALLEFCQRPVMPCCPRPITTMGIAESFRCIQHMHHVFRVWLPVGGEM